MCGRCIRELLFRQKTDDTFDIGELKGFGEEGQHA